MQANPPANPWLQRAGIVLSVLPCLLLLMSGAMKLSQQQDIIDAFTHFGYPPALLVPIGGFEVFATVLFLIPQTAVLGAVLLTGYLGGAAATHIRLGEPFTTPLLVAAVVWIALYLRDARVRALVPLRR